MLSVEYSAVNKLSVWSRSCLDETKVVSDELCKFLGDVVVAACRTGRDTTL
jgi:hypothetical protein